MSEYYVLDQEGESVFIELGYEPGYGKILALAIYTTEDGGQQREDLQRYKNTEVWYPWAPRRFLRSYRQGAALPSS